VLIQVNIDDEASKHGCAPEEVEALAAAIAAEPPAPARPDGDSRAMARAERRGMHSCACARFPVAGRPARAGRHAVDGHEQRLRRSHRRGRHLVRIGTALFGARPRPA
jgi:hypothetical protein